MNQPRILIQGISYYISDILYKYLLSREFYNYGKGQRKEKRHQGGVESITRVMSALLEDLKVYHRTEHAYSIIKHKR